MREKIERIAEVVRSGDNFLVASHLNPDGDAIGSSLALGLALEAMGKSVVIYNVDPVPSQFKFLHSAGRIVQDIEPGHVFDAAFVLDCAELTRVGRDFEEMVSTKCWINIDHHLTNKEFADISIIDQDACSTGYLVYEVIKALPVEISREMAENIYTTIIFDTGSFRYSNSTIEAFNVAGEMVALGVSPWGVANKVYESQPHGRLKLLQRVLGTLEVSDDGKVASVVVTKQMMKETETGSDATDGFVNYPRSIDGVEVAIMVREVGDNEYKISYRSKEKVNVADVAQTFGGGGHRNAAGCVIRESEDEARRCAVDAVKEVLYSL